MLLVGPITVAFTFVLFLAHSELTQTHHGSSPIDKDYISDWIDDLLKQRSDVVNESDWLYKCHLHR